MDGEKPTLNPLTRDALKTAIGSEKPIPLKKVGRTAGLTPGGKDTAAKMAARAQCLDTRLGLFEKTGGSDDNPLLRITPAGVESLLADSEPDERTELQAKAAEPFKAVIDAALTKLATDELKEIGERRAALDRQSSELRAQLSGMWKEQLAAVERAVTELRKQEEDIRAQMAADKGKGTDDTPEPPETEPDGRIKRPKPETDGDIDFQRDLCRELALVWEDTPEPDVRDALERVMLNAGLEQVGEVGESVGFDASQHKLASGSVVLPGQPVKVVEPGWVFRSPRGVLQIVKSKVASAPS
jgi:hypothetical protein